MVLFKIKNKGKYFFLRKSILYIFYNKNRLFFTLDGKMFQAQSLVNGETIFQENNIESIEYYHIELSNHYSILANEILSESFKDFNNKYVLKELKSDSKPIILPSFILA